MNSGPMDIVTTKRCFESARRAAIQLQIATVDAHRLLSRTDRLSGPTTANLHMIWRYGLFVEDLLVQVAQDSGIPLPPTY
jgi:hypothetical protein